MKKILVLLLAIGANAFAGRGALVMINNMTDNPLKIENTNSSCISDVNNLNTVVNENSLSIPYIEADGSGACAFKSSTGSFSIDDTAITANYSLSATAAKTSFSASSNLVNAFYVDNLSILQNQVLFILNVKPDNYSTYASWMENIKATDKPIKSLIIPGTHDSFSYDLSGTVCNSDPDASQWFNLVNKLPAGSDVVSNFAKAQHYNFDEQLANGIRYFDMRLCYQNNQVYAEHSMITNSPVNNYIANLASYLQQHPNELVILDLNHMYGFNSAAAIQSLNALLTPLNDHIADNSLSPNSSLSDFRQKNKNLIVLLDNANLATGVSFNYWKQNNIVSHWSSHATNIDTALSDQSNAINNRDNTANQLFVSQLIENADGDFIKNNYSRSLLYFAYEDLPKIHDWINTNRNNNLNIIIENYANGIDTIKMFNQ